jgi:hypothetical protein
MTTLPNDNTTSRATTGTEGAVSTSSTTTTTGPSLVPLAPSRTTITLPNDDDDDDDDNDNDNDAPVTAATSATPLGATFPTGAAGATASPRTSTATTSITVAGVTSTIQAANTKKLKSYHHQKEEEDDDSSVTQNRLLKTELSEFQSVVAVVAYDILETELSGIKTKPANQKMDMIFDVCHGIIGTVGDDNDPNKRPSQFDLLVEGKDKRYKKLWREEEIYDDHEEYNILLTDIDDSSSNNNNNNQNQNNNSKRTGAGTGTIRVIKSLYNCRSRSTRCRSGRTTGRNNIRLIAGVDVTTDFLRRGTLNKNHPIKGRTLIEMVTTTIQTTKVALSYAYQFLDQKGELQEGTTVNNLMNYILDKMWIDENNQVVVVVNAVNDDSSRRTIHDINQIPPRPADWIFKGYMAFCLFACPIITNPNDRLSMFFDTTKTATAVDNDNNNNNTNVNVNVNVNEGVKNTNKNNTSSYHEESLQAESDNADDNGHREGDGDGDGDGDSEQQHNPPSSTTTKSVRHRQQHQQNTTSIRNNRAIPEPPEQQQQQQQQQRVVASSCSNVDDGLMKIYETRFQGILNERTQVMELVKFYHHDMKDTVGTKRQLDVLNELEIEIQQLKKKMKSTMSVDVISYLSHATVNATTTSKGGYKKRRTQPLPTSVTAATPTTPTTPTPTQEGAGGNSSSQAYIV